MIIKNREVQLSKEGAQLPEFLKEIAHEWHSVVINGEAIGDVYRHNDSWKAFYVTVTDVDGTLEGCISWLISNT